MGIEPVVRRLFCACIFTLFAGPAFAAAGTISGSFDVSPQGGATYSIPITVPPGTAGMEPKLSLRYSSEAGNGLLGVGWSLAGLSQIGRCPATLEQDGFIDAVDFDDNDRLCLDGARLVAVSGTYGHNGAEYRTEIERFVRVKQRGGDLNSGDVWFEVATKSGLIKEYGRRNESAFHVPGKTYTHLWSVDRIADTAGNYIDVTYALDSTTKERYVDRIDYTGNDQAGVSAYNSVRFVYDPSGRPDKASRYMPGGSDKITTARRLSAIKTYAQTSVVREYALSYTTGSTSGLSLLSSLQECAYPASGPADCLPETAFEWTQTTPGFSAYPALVPPFDLRLSDGRQRGEAIDINGDGRTDFVRAHGSTRKTWLNTIANGQQSWQETPGYKLPDPLFKDSGRRRAVLADVNGDGLPDFVEAYSESNQRTYLNTGSGWQVDDTYRLPRRLFDGDSRPEGALQDINGDGLEDLIISTRLVRYETNSAGDITNIWVESETNEVYINKKNTCSGASCRWQRSFTYDLPTEAMYTLTKSQFSQEQLYTRGKLRDVNGDGLLDYAYIHTSLSEFYDAEIAPRSEAVINTGSGWDVGSVNTMPAPVARHMLGINPAELADVNGDGLTDVVCSTYAIVSSYDISELPICGLDSVHTLIQDAGFFKLYYVRATYINTGDGYLSDPTYNLPAPFFIKVGNTDPRGALFVDLTDDGRPEFIKAHGDEVRETYVNAHASQCATEGCRWQLDPAYQLPFDYFESFDARIRGVANQFDLDGRVDFVASAQGITNAVYATNGSQPNGDRPDLLKAISPGNAAASVEVRYTTLLDNRHFTRGTDGYPSPSVTGSQSVVAESVRDAGSTSASSRYRYEDLRANLLGRGTLGFRKFTAENVEAGMREVTEFAQAFPHTGMALSSTGSAVEYYQIGDLYYPLSEITLTRTINTPATDQLGSGASTRYFPYVATSDQQFFDLVDNTAPLTTSRTETDYDNYGNAVQVVQKQFQGASPGTDTHTSVTTSQYTNDTSQWLLGRLTQSTVTKTGPGSSSVTRETGFEYDAVTGLLTAEIVEPNKPALRKRTDYQYDSFGNQVEVTISGSDIATRVTTTTWDSRGQFKTSVTNALGHSETHVYSSRHGGQTSLTGPNNLTTTWSYDAFGRGILQIAPDGTTVGTSYEECGPSCPSPEGVFAVRTTGSDGSESLQVFDRLERKILESAKGYDGSWIDVLTQYDNRDRAIAESAPFYRGGDKHWTTYEYDDHDRLVHTESPTNDSTSDGLTIGVVYDGLIVRQTDPNGKISEKHHNAAGHTIKVIDALSGTTDFEYDPYGNKVQVTDAASNVTTIQYDTLGRKVAMSDPDMGNWTYGYNVLGELVSQTDAKSQTVTMAYDKLGRMIQRTEPEGASTWTYDTGWVGKADTETAPGGFQRDYVYDSLGRVADVVTVIDSQTYTVSRTYDGQSRLNKLTYPSGLAVRHNYTASGDLAEVVHDATNEPYWQLDHRDAFGNVELETLGNGHSTLRNHDDARGHVDSILTGDVMGTEIQSLTYSWGKVGNLLSRADQNQGGLIEEFAYDDLYRLTGSTLDGSGNLSVGYDAVGNITSKTGVGSYTYGAGSAGPHAVTQITGARAATYSYDANGNMLQGGGRTLTWTSFNKPATITQGNGYSQFHYGPDRARYKHLRERDEGSQMVSTTIHYVDSLYERHFEGAGFEDRHYIRADGRTIAIEITPGTGAPYTHYLHRDHLGSVDAITDAAGNLVERYSYDAFGKRRTLAWNDDASDGLLYLSIQVLERGYTGHEHLDHVGLIHMNGRVYDPIVGRFTSADPFVQFPESTQGLNRYTYVNNSPLSYTDPSGFFSFSLGDLFKALINPAILVNEYIADNPRQSIAIGLMVVPGGQILGVQSFAAGFAVATAQGFAAGMVAGHGDLKAGLMGAATAGAFYGVGSAFQGLQDPNGGGFLGTGFTGGEFAGKVIVHGAVGGAASDWYGGSFTDGFLGAATGQALGATALSGVQDPVLKIGLAGLIGGTASYIGGGKFANGAITATFGEAFNGARHGARRRAYREALAARGSTTIPALQPGIYSVVVDSVSITFTPLSIEIGDIWVIDIANEQVLHYAYAGGGPAVGIAGVASREFGALHLSNASTILGFSLGGEFDGVPGFGGTGTLSIPAVPLNPKSTSFSGGPAIGLGAGVGGVGTYAWFQKAYRFSDAPSHLPLGK